MSGIRFRADDSDEYWFEEGCYILEYLNDPADPQASIARARVPRGGRTRPHRLIGTTERYLIQHGHGHVQIGDGEAIPVEPGDAILIPPGEAQSISNTGDGDLVILVVCTPRFDPANYRSSQS